MSNYKLACSRMWTDINVNLNRKEIVNCCKRSQRHQPTIDEINNLGLDFWTARPEIIEEKKQFVDDNVFPQGCKACSKTHPYSQWNSWNLWQNQPDTFYNKDLIYEDKTNYIAISLSSTCNQACLYCNAEVSSLWAKKLGITPVESDQQWKDTALNSLYNYIDNRVAPYREKVKYNLLGGETFLDYSFFDVIERLSEIHTRQNTPNVTIEFISNLNIKPAVLDKFIEITKRYDNINWYLSGSIENLGKRAEASRVGLDYNLFESNLDRIIGEPSLDVIQILPTMNMLSITDHADFLRWVVSKFENTRGMDNILKTWGMTINSVTDGPMNPSIAPISFATYLDDAKEVVQSIIDNTPENRKSTVRYYQRHLDDIKARLGSARDDKTLGKSLMYMHQQGPLHGFDYWNIFPELDDIFPV